MIKCFCKMFIVSTLLVWTLINKHIKIQSTRMRTVFGLTTLKNKAVNFRFDPGSIPLSKGPGAYTTVHLYF